jgi:hypothetical protein
MSNPPETPQDFFKYFQDQALHAEPPSPKWAVGLEAAQLWVAYSEKKEANPEPLINFIILFMPYRFMGSGFHALWLNFLSTIRTLPVLQQIPIWQAVFATINHGEKPLPHPERAEAVIQHWQKLIQQQNPVIELEDMDALAKVFGPDFVPCQEWFTLIEAIDNWFKPFLSEPSFIDLVLKIDNPSSKS